MAKQVNYWESTIEYEKFSTKSSCFYTPVLLIEYVGALLIKEKTN
jgi:hypothetical protein